MAGISTLRKNKPRKNAKFVVDYFTKEEIADLKQKGLSFTGCIISLKRAEITKVDQTLIDSQHYESSALGNYEVYSRDATYFHNLKEMRKFRKENSY